MSSCLFLDLKLLASFSFKIKYLFGKAILGTTLGFKALRLLISIKKKKIVALFIIFVIIPPDYALRFFFL